MSVWFSFRLSLAREMRFPNPTALYISIVVGVSSALLIGSSSAVSWDKFPQMLFFLLLIAIASFLIIQNPSGGVLSSTGTLFYMVLYVFNPPTAFVIAALGYAIGNTLPRKWATWRACFNGAQMGLSVFLGSLAYRALGGNLAESPITSQLLPAFAGPLVHQIANNFFVGLLISQERKIRFFLTWVSFVWDYLWSNLLSIPTAILIAILYVRVHHAFALIFLASLPFQRWAMKLYLDKRNTYRRIIERLARASELSRPETRGHGERVAKMSVAIARRLGMTDREVEGIEYASLLHDIGLIGLDEIANPNSVLEDPRGWNETHARLGADIVSELGRPDITEIVLNHHRSFRDVGQTRVGGNRISRSARVLSLAEEVDSRLHGFLPYESAASLEEVMQFVIEGRGIRFDPAVVDAFLLTVRDANAGLSIGPESPAPSKA